MFMCVVSRRCCSLELLSEAVKILKGFYTVEAIRKFKMDRALIFCRTKVDCDNMEAYLNTVGEGRGLIINNFTWMVNNVETQL